MNHTANYIKNRLSLRKPQERSLEILSGLTEEITLAKTVDLAAELEKVKCRYSTCMDFERDFPSICFALATGVGQDPAYGSLCGIPVSRRLTRKHAPTENPE